MILEGTEQALLAMELFMRTYGTFAAEAFNQFTRRLGLAKLPWVLEKLRKDTFPPNPGLEEGFPDFYYYYVPGSQRGSHLPPPDDPLGSEFTARADGVGLNMGCPIRLHLALKVLEKIEPNFDGECSANLKVPHLHLSTVEELLWGDAWNDGIKVDRLARGNGNKRPDWRVIDQSGEIFVEAKFLPSDWARLVDGPHQLPRQVLKRASDQLPKTKDFSTLNVTALTGLKEMEGELGEEFAKELLAYPHIDAVLYRALLGDTWILSLSALPIIRLRSALRLQCTSDFQPSYPVTWGISDKELRRTYRNEEVTDGKPDFEKRGILYFECMPLTGAVTRFRIPPFTYRRTLLGRKSDDEPIFKIEAPYIEK